MTALDIMDSKKPSIEIERKFLVNAVPDNLQEFENTVIRQGYLVIGDDGSEVRLRDRNGQYTLTTKSKGELSRGEWETPIRTEQFEALWPATVGKRVEKTRYAIPLGDVTIELDVYQGELEGLVSAEVEFPDEATARAFTPPKWMSVDVTNDKAFKNQQLALNGLPSQIQT